ncbi:hypothetical protein [Phyllobacterium ifriqiyense]|uniref:hypothetical protein n=1 Tax=Phyllobacterium ifriqiyense TaxID=314238 RepID=UPI003390E738
MPVLTLDQAQNVLLKRFYAEAAHRLADSSDPQHIRALKLLPIIDEITAERPITLSRSDVENMAMVVDLALSWHLAATPAALSSEEHSLAHEIQAKLLQANRT